MDALGGHLLIAGPDLWDPNFRRTVVLIGHHDEDGAVGVVLNRASSLTVLDVVPTLAELVPDGESLFLGGPVQRGAAVVLADFVEPERAEILALGSIGFLPEEVEADTVGGIRRARVFAGYAGWGAGQLEAEMESSSWISEPARADDVFTVKPEHLWEQVLARKGHDYDLLRFMPVDPSLN